MTERVPSVPTTAVDTMDATPAVPPGPAAARQRHALTYLSRFEYPVELRTLATAVAAAMENVPAECVSDRSREERAVALHHIDLPRLVAADVAEYDPESRMIVTAEPHVVERYVDATDGFRSSDPI